MDNCGIQEITKDQRPEINQEASRDGITDSGEDITGKDLQKVDMTMCNAESSNPVAGEPQNRVRSMEIKEWEDMENLFGPWMLAKKKPCKKIVPKPKSEKTKEGLKYGNTRSHFENLRVETTSDPKAGDRATGQEA